MGKSAIAAVTLAMRVGYATRGLIYSLVGLVALGAALGDTQAEGLLGSLRRLKDAPMNEPILLVLAGGLVAYAVWRGLDSIIDLAGHGRGFGLVERGGLFFVSLLHVALAWYAVKLAFGGAAFATSSRSQLASALSGMMDSEPGRGFIGLVGLGTVSFGFYSISKGVLGRYRRHMRSTRLMERVAPMLGFGLIARGIVLGIMGAFIIWAAWTHDPGAAGGYGQTLGRIRDAWHGRALLGIAGAGMVAFSFYCYCEAIFRVIPPRPAAGKAGRCAGDPPASPRSSRTA